MTATSLNSKYRVNSNGFALFVIGLTLAGFLGGAVRFFLGSDKAQERILSELKSKVPEWQIETDRVQLLLASGIWPGLTMVVPKANLIRQGHCELAQIRVRLDGMRLPISLWALLSGKSQLGDVYIENLEVEMDQESCDKKVSLSAPQNSPENPSATATEVKSEGLQNLGLEKAFDEIQKRIDSLTIRKASLSDLNQLNWSLVAENFSLNVGSWIRAQGQFSIWKRFELNELRQSFSFIANLQGSLLDWKINSQVKEGEVEWFGQLDESGRTFLQRLSIRQGPVADIFEFFKTAGLTTKSLPTRRAWLNCRLSQGGTFKKLKDVKVAAIRIELCELEGEGGKLAVSPVTVYPKAPHFRNGPLEFSSTQIPLQTLAKFLDVKIADRVISNLGRLTARGKVYAAEKWSLSGQLEDLQISISNDSLRGIETISNLRFVVEKHWDELKLQLSDFKILGGSRGGDIHLRVNPKDKSGDLKFSFEGLSLSQNAQNLLFRGQGTPIHLKGFGRLEDGELRSSEGTFKWDAVEGRGWTSDSVNGNFRFQKGQFLTTVKMKSFTWTKPYFYMEFLDQIKKILNVSDSATTLSNIEVDLKVHSQGGEVDEAKGLLGSSNLIFAGQWARAGSLTGTLTKKGKGHVKVPIELSPRQAKILK